MIKLTTIEPKSVLAGDPVSFHCDLIRNLRDVKFKWMKNGEALTPSERINVVEVGDSSILVIRRTQVRDSGSYTCLASNGDAESRRTTRLSIYGKIFVDVPI